MKSFLAEPKRRYMLRVAVAYLVLAWLLLQVGSVLLPTFHAPDWVMQALVLVLLAGFVATTVATLVVRNGALAVAPSAPSDAAQDPEPAPRLEPKATDARPSIAVLPFVNLSALAENEYFADGLSETLLNMLAQVSGLKVAARTSAFAFKGSKTDIRKIAHELNVKNVLEGSVQRAGTRVRITAQLIDAVDGSHLWSKSYDRTLDDIFAIQDGIATAVAAELTRSLLGVSPVGPRVASPGTRNPAAYDLYLRALEQQNLGSHGSLPRAERLLKDTLEADPGFSDARIVLARTYLGMAETGLLGLPEAVQRGRALLAPLIQGAESDLVALAYDATMQWRAASASAKSAAARHALESTLRALDERPNDVALYPLAANILQEDEGRSAEVLALLERGLEIDPLSARLLNAKGRRLLIMGRHDDALAAHARARGVAPASPAGYYRAGQVYSARGPYVEAVMWYARAAAIDRDDHELPASVAQHLLAIGLPAEALPWLRRAELLNAAGSDTRRVEMLYAAQTGDVSRTLDLAADVMRERRDNRRNVYGTALCMHFTLSHEAGRLDAALDLLSSVSPGLLDVPPRTLTSEFDILGLWTASQFIADTWSMDQRDAVLAALATAERTLEHDDFEFGGGGFDAVLAALQGDHARAAERIEALLATPQALPWHWRIFLRSPALARAVKDPRVIAGIARLEADFARQAVRYRGLVADGEIAVP